MRYGQQCNGTDQHPADGVCCFRSTHRLTALSEAPADISEGGPVSHRDAAAIHVSVANAVTDKRQPRWGQRPLPPTKLSPLVEALNRSAEYGITVVSMKRDWKVVFE
jgi:hypothetical protein